jgi:hypothetical protein
MEERWGPNYMTAGRDYQDGQPGASTTESRKPLGPVVGGAPDQRNAPHLKIRCGARLVIFHELDAGAASSRPLGSTASVVSVG